MGNTLMAVGQFEGLATIEFMLVAARGGHRGGRESPGELSGPCQLGFRTFVWQPAVLRRDLKTMGLTGGQPMSGARGGQGEIDVRVRRRGRDRSGAAVGLAQPWDWGHFNLSSHFNSAAWQPLSKAMADYTQYWNIKRVVRARGKGDTY
jgi:hypothetical protein